MVRRWFHRHSKQLDNHSTQIKEDQSFTLFNIEDYKEVQISKSIDDNVKKLQKIFAGDDNVKYRTVYSEDGKRFVLVYRCGIVDNTDINQHIIFPIVNTTVDSLSDVKEFADKNIVASEYEMVTTYKQIIQGMYTGQVILLVEGFKSSIAIDISDWKSRSIEEPQAEIVVKGPREGFTESLATNRILIYRHIKSPSLKMKEMKVGRQMQTSVMIAYMEGIANENLVAEVSNRLSKIDIDGVIGSNVISEFIEDTPYTVFALTRSTERSDVVASSLLEGRVAILVDGTPIQLIAPTTFFTSTSSSEDYYQRFPFATATRLLRYLFLGIALLLPSLYVSVLTFHHAMIPKSLMLGLAGTRELLPFPAFIEALLMELIFEALREAGARLPKQVGSAVSIVGALVIGEAAVSAGIVSSPMVMIVAITGIANFMIPGFDLASSIRILRFPMIFLAGTMGLLGVMLGLIALVIHLCTLRSFGVPYLAPVAPLNIKELNDVLIRAPFWKLSRRPHLTGEYNAIRQKPNLKPNPEDGGE